jgi:hypothetical protein
LDKELWYGSSATQELIFSIPERGRDNLIELLYTSGLPNHVEIGMISWKGLFSRIIYKNIRSEFEK